MSTSTPFLNLIVAGLILAVIQVLAAIPWVATFDGRPFRRWITDPKVLAYLSGGTFALGVALGFYLSTLGDIADLEQKGRWYAALLHIQIVLDFALLAPRALVAVWPKGGAVAY